MERVDVVISKQEVETIVEGLSVKNDILGEAIFNDLSEKIGTIDDIIISPMDYSAYAIIGVGGFLGIGKYDVAVPMQQLECIGDDFMLPGGTKEKLKALPKFEYGQYDNDDERPH